MTSRAPVEVYRPGADVGSRDLAEVQRIGSRMIAELYERAPWLAGVLLVGVPDAATGRVSNGIAFTGGIARSLKHQLNRAARGWWVVRDFGVNPHELSETGNDERTLTLVSPSDCTVSLWVW